MRIIIFLVWSASSKADTIFFCKCIDGFIDKFGTTLSNHLQSLVTDRVKEGVANVDQLHNHLASLVGHGGILDATAVATGDEVVAVPEGVDPTTFFDDPTGTDTPVVGRKPIEVPEPDLEAALGFPALAPIKISNHTSDLRYSDLSPDTPHPLTPDLLQLSFGATTLAYLDTKAKDQLASLDFPFRQRYHVEVLLRCLSNANPSENTTANKPRRSGSGT